MNLKALQDALMRPDGITAAMALLTPVFGRDRLFPHAGTLLRALRGEEAPLDQVPAEGWDRLFLANLRRVAERARPGAAGAARREAVADLPEALDFLQHLCDPRDWTLAQTLNLLAMRQARPTRRLAAVLLARDEGVTLVEWLAHHQALGVEHVFVYTNDNADGSDRLLDVLAGHGLATVLRNRIGKGVNPQLKAYQHALHFLHELREYEWAYFVDADEFLVLSGRHGATLPTFLDACAARFPERPPAAVLFPWKWRLTDLALRPSEGLLLQRYPHALPHSHCKPVVRLAEAVTMCQVHLPLSDAGSFLADSDLRPLPEARVWDQTAKSDAGGHINHYWSRSFVEFVVKKRRGDRLALASEIFHRDYRLFFAWTAAMRPETLDPPPAAVVAETLRRRDAILALPGVADAAAEVDRAFRRQSDELAGDPEMLRLYRRMREEVAPSLGPAPRG